MKVKRQIRSHVRRAVTGVLLLALNASLAALLLLSPGTSAQAEAPPPFHQHTATKAPTGPPPTTSGPLKLPTADIASPQKHQVPARPQTGPQINTTANANTFDMKVLVLAADGTEADLGAIRQVLDELGTPYSVFQGAPVPADPSTNRLSPMLSDGVSHGYFQAVILTTGTLGYTSGTSSVSALTTTEWNALYNYEASFSVRQVTWYTYPNADYGFAGTPTSGSAVISVPFTAAGTTVFGSYANTTTPLTLDGGVFTYFAKPADANTQALLSDASGDALAAIRTYPDGRKNLAVTFDSNQYLTHDLVLAYGLINWVTNGLFLGERHVYQRAQPDDYFIADDTWQPAMACGSTTYTTSYRVNSADVTALVAWQTKVNGPAATKQIKLEIPFNGVGSVANYVPGEPSPTLVAATTANKAAFDWLSHTYDHADLNSADATQSQYEIASNNQVATTLALPNYAADAILTPGVTGLTNPNFLQTAVNDGIKYAITDTSLPQYNNPSPNAGIYNSLQPTILMVPRHATNLYYNVSTPDEWLAEDHCLYPATVGGVADPAYAPDYAHLLDRESSMLLTYLLKGDIDPLMFHQSNLRVYPSTAGAPNDGTHSLLSDLMDATYAKYTALFNLPIVSMNTDGIGARMAARMQYNAALTAGLTAKAVIGTNGISSITITASSAATVPVTGMAFTCPTCTSETYGGQTIERVTLAAGQSVTLYNTAVLSSVNPTSGPVAGGAVVTIRGGGFQAGATVAFGANTCTNVAIADSATIRCTVPAGVSAGPVDVKVATGGATLTLPGGYTYFAGTITPDPSARPAQGIAVQSGVSPLPTSRPGPSQPAGSLPAPSPLPLSR